MPSIIKQLSKEIINLISAGEVIESPKNVIKELVENSIDAKSTIIKVSIETMDNKIKKIIVTDNGKGMEKDDILKSIEPHATSKINDKDDLFCISTMGFRGEALSSIASISYLTIKSKQKNNDGYFYSFQAGKVVDEGITPINDGTIIEVSNLFFNTPARFKHLKSLTTEISNITRILENIACSHPEIKFIYLNNNNIIFQTEINSDLKQVLNNIYGENIVDYLKYFECNNGLYKINGYASNNNTYKNNKSYITIIVNNRVVQNQNILFSITDAYKSIIPIGKYPIVILNITTDPTLIDVNVHPSKLEVRFTDEYALRQTITQAIRQTLYEEELIYSVKEDDVKNNISDYINNNNTINNNTINNNIIKETEKEEDYKNLELDSLWNNFFKENDSYNNSNSNNINNNINNNQKDLFDDIEQPKQTTNLSNNTTNNTVDNTIDNFDNQDIIIDPLISTLCFKFENLKYLGQYNKTYLLLEDDNDLYLIDQHAAMERIMYEKVIDALNKEEKECIELLIPEKMNFSSSDSILINNHIEDIKKIGIEIEYFGGLTYLIRTYPIWLPKGQEISFITEIIDLIIHDKKASRTILYDRISKTIACKKSIKANMLITKEEVLTLLSSLDKCKMPWTCPHGRPTTIKLTKYEIEKMFKRVI